MPPSRRRQQANQHNSMIQPLALLVGFVVAPVAFWFGMPGAAVLWLGLIVAGFGAEPAVYTGKKDKRGYATALNDAEEAKMNEFRFWEHLRNKLLMPNGSWLPTTFDKGKASPLVISLIAVVLAFITGYLPQEYEWGHAVNAVTTYVMVMGYAGAKRLTVRPGEESPGVRLGSFPAMAKKPGFWVMGVVGAAVGFVLIYGLSTLSVMWRRLQLLTPYLTDIYTNVGKRDVMWWPLFVAFAVLGLLGGVFGTWKREALHDWETTCAARVEWSSIWESLPIKSDSYPTLLKRVVHEVGDAKIFHDTFETKGTGIVISQINLMYPQLEGLFGANSRVCVMEASNEDAKGQPMPGTVHPTKFEVVVFQEGSTPDLNSSPWDLLSDNEQEIVRLYLRALMLWTADGRGGTTPGYDRGILTQVIDLTAYPSDEPDESDEPESVESPVDADADENGDGEPAAPRKKVRHPKRKRERPAWLNKLLHGPDAKPERYNGPTALATTWTFTKGLELRTFRAQLAGALAAVAAPTATLVKSRPRNDAAILFGDLFNPSLEVNGELGFKSRQDIEWLAEEDVWAGRWASVLKQNVNAPVPARLTKLTDKVGSVDVFSQSFMVMVGESVGDYITPKMESTMATAIESTSFVSLQHFIDARSATKDRLPSGFTLVWSQSVLPRSPEAVEPSSGRGSLWVLNGLLRQAFTNARLARPDVVAVRALNGRGSPSLRPSGSPMRGQRMLGGRNRYLWELTVILRDGVTFSMVRTQYKSIMESLSTSWMRIAGGADGEDQVKFYVGANPATLDSLSASDRQRIVELDWEQGWIDAGVAKMGRAPKRIKTETMPGNENVYVMTFELPSGFDLNKDVKEKAGKLASATNNQYVEIRSAKGAANQFIVQCATLDPMPEFAGFDFSFDFKTGLPMGTLVNGDYALYNSATGAHLLIAGTSGGGKVQPANTLVRVPLSAQFPTGIARWDALKVGDILFSGDGGTTTITEVHPWHMHPMFKVTFDTGQTAVVGGNHLWRASTRLSRAAHDARNVRRRADFAAMPHRQRFLGIARHCSELAERYGREELLTVAELASLTGVEATALYRYGVDAIGVPVVTPAGRRCRVFDGRAVWALFAKHEIEGKRPRLAGKPIPFGNIGRLNDEVAHIDGGWITARQIADTLTGHRATRAEMAGVNKRLRVHKIAYRNDGEATTTVWGVPAREMLLTIAADYQSMADLGLNKRSVQPIEALFETKHMVSALDHDRFAVRAPKGIEGLDTDLPIDPWLLGAWLGDGSTNNEILAVGRADIDWTGPAVAEAWPDCEVKDHQGKAGLYHTVRMNGLRAKLRETGMLGNKHIPVSYLRASAAQRLALLQGLVDTDGYVALDGQTEICLSDEQLALDALELVRSLGIKAFHAINTSGYRDEDGAHRPCKDRHRIKFTTDTQVARMPRKVERLPKPDSLRGTSEWLYITSIEPAGIQRGRCITVDHDLGSYLTDSWVPTHNSVTGQVIMSGCLLSGAEIAIIDKQKSGADFMFAKPWAFGWADTTDDASALMKAVYAEVQRRAKLNAQHGVGAAKDLPENVRPKPWYVFVDEFAGLIEKPPKPSSRPEMDPELEADRVAELENYNAVMTFRSMTQKIAAEARSADVHLVLMTQKLSSTMLDGLSNLKNNLARILLGKASAGDRASALRDPFNAPSLGEIIPKGRGLFEPNEGATQIIQAWFAPQSDYSTHLEGRVPKSGFVLDVDPFRPKKIDTGGVDITAEVIEGELEVEELEGIELEMDDFDLGELVLDDFDLTEVEVDPDTAEEPEAELMVDLVDDTDAEPETEPVKDELPELDWGDASVSLIGDTEASDDDLVLIWDDEPETSTSAPDEPLWDEVSFETSDEPQKPAEARTDAIEDVEWDDVSFEPQEPADSPEDVEWGDEPKPVPEPAVAPSVDAFDPFGGADEDDLFGAPRVDLKKLGDAPTF